MPLIASAGDCLCLVLSRNPQLSTFPLVQDQLLQHPTWNQEEESHDVNNSPRHLTGLTKSPSSSSAFGASNYPASSNGNQPPSSFNSVPQPYVASNFNQSSSSHYASSIPSSFSPSYSNPQNSYSSSLTVLKTV